MTFIHRSFPISLQHDSMMCGVACLQMICRHYGKNYTQDELSDICHTGLAGVSLLGLADAAETLGFRIFSSKFTVDNLGKILLPCILHWNQSHFVVLYKVEKGKYYIADPGKGRITYQFVDFVRHWAGGDADSKGIAMLMEPTEVFHHGIPAKKVEGKRSFRFILNYLRQYSSWLLQVVLGLFVGSLLQLAFPFLTQSIVDIGIRDKDIGFVWLVLIGQVFITFSRTAVDFIRRWLLLHISMRINISLVSDFFIKLMQLPMSFFDAKRLGDLLQRIGDHSRINSFLTGQVLGIIFSSVNFVVFGAVLLVYSKQIFFVFLFFCVLYAGWMLLFLHQRKIIDYEIFEEQAANSNKTYQLITAMQEIKLQGCELRRRWDWEDIQADLFVTQMKSLKFQQAQEAGAIFFNELKNIIITVLSATAVIKGELTIGMMLSVQYIIGQLNGPVERLMALIYSIQDVRISLERINEVHEKSNEDTAERTRVSFADCKLDIRLEHVGFRYDPHALHKTLDDICIHIPEGKVTAIVGASGSGKTTLVKLMLGYYPLESGRIMISGANIEEYNMRWWREQCGVVMQDGVIFSESIARNIAVDNNDVDAKRLEWASQIANVEEIVTNLPLGYDTIIGKDGLGLSQGQKQRILIARAVYKTPSYVFLDEATNSLDAHNERLITEKLNHFFSGKTVVIVAHRLSTVMNADQIVVMERGKVVECGTHQTLTALHGIYYKLVKNQLELGL